MSITLYTKDRCVQCNATKRALDKLHIEYDTVDVAADDEALAHITGMGYQQVPVVEAGDAHWSGFRPDRIKELVSTMV